ncbi:nucleotidyltransferase family protein [Halalkalibacter okhensis]|uniref:nucleotidyltransferase family protein n=1 Tax=Halalkalibacter okhensis TaxID=333138 RepID=UPI00126A15BA|nr:nucleotidyltransferase family protein [Halalkalibacter okhensis]
MDHKVCAVILAAGTSSRMGTTKQLLKIDGKILLERVLEQVLLHPFEKVVVVLGHQSKEIKESMKITSKKVSWIYNSNYRLGQSTSFLTGLEHIDSACPSVVFFLSDQPFIKNATVTNVINEGRRRVKVNSAPFVVRPYYDQKPGHPIFWGNIKDVDFSRLTGDLGGRGILSSVKKVKLIVNDAGILFDIDTPEDYHRALQERG